MMDRQQMLAILSSMSDDALMKACSANGIECGGGSYQSDMGGESPAEGLESWNDTRIDMPMSKRPPILDTGKILAAQKQAAQPRPQVTRDMLGPEATGIEDMAPIPGEASGAF